MAGHTTGMAHILVTWPVYVTVKINRVSYDPELFLIKEFVSFCKIYTCNLFLIQLNSMIEFNILLLSSAVFIVISNFQ